jgi:hypothetical protein
MHTLQSKKNKDQIFFLEKEMKKEKRKKGFFAGALRVPLARAPYGHPDQTLYHSSNHRMTKSVQLHSPELFHNKNDDRTSKWELIEV